MIGTKEESDTLVIYEIYFFNNRKVDKMESLLTWKYYLVAETDFPQVKDLAEELDTLRNRELTDEENERKESLISQIDELGSKIAAHTLVYQDRKDIQGHRDGTVCEELVYRLDEAPEVRQYTDPDEFYFKFLVYITPEGLQKQYPTIQKIFDIVENHELLKEEFLGEWRYLQRAKSIFFDLKMMYEDAYKNNWGLVKIDRLEWLDEEIEEEETGEVPMIGETHVNEEYVEDKIENDAELELVEVDDEMDA